MSVRKLNLALQGGGAHGAFTWGVLDRLLEEPGLRFEGISGASAGAMNAVMLASGLLQGGPEGAKDLLSRFWHEVSLHALPELPKGAPGESITDWMQVLGYFLSPADLNPLDINPLRSLVERMVDFEQLRAKSSTRLFIAATDVESGKIRLFRESELRTDHLLASACLPSLHKAIEIDGRSYWDGGFSGNPAIYPLIFDCDSDDVLVVLLQPLMREGTPVSAKDIRDRVADFGFQNTFLREMSSLSHMQFEICKTPFSISAFERRVRRLRLHLIETDEHLAFLDRASKYDTRLHFLESLRNRGRERAQGWLEQHGSRIGRQSSCDLGLFM